MSTKNSLRVGLASERLEKVAAALSQLRGPAVSGYDLGRLIFAAIQPYSSNSAKAELDQILASLLGFKLLTPLDSSEARHAYLLFGRKEASPAEIMCSLDPFAYVSHLSAMEHHGLTDRFSKILYMTRPLATEWRNQAALRMEKDLGDDLDAYKKTGLPRLVRPALNMIGHTSVEFHERSQLGAFRNVSESPLRVATLGRVFLDMLREPKLCGGLQHVIDIYEREAKQYLKLITDEVDRHGQAIDKVRIGYVLTEVCHLSSPAIDKWTEFAQRGGSRKLDADAEYSAVYSERWQLSINLPSLTAQENNDR
jgi:predicted transcriptional regulator of viral defense system